MDAHLLGGALRGARAAGDGGPLARAARAGDRLRLLSGQGERAAGGVTARGLRLSAGRCAPVSAARLSEVQRAATSPHRLPGSAWSLLGPGPCPQCGPSRSGPEATCPEGTHSLPSPHHLPKIRTILKAREQKRAWSAVMVPGSSPGRACPQRGGRRRGGTEGHLEGGPLDLQLDL